MPVLRFTTHKKVQRRLKKSVVCQACRAITHQHECDCTLRTRSKQHALGGQGMGRYRRHNAGFTLIELMVVIIILGLLAAIVMPRIVGETDKARYGAALAQMRILEDALKRYKLDNGV